jgi:hypothetical protein
MAGSRVDDVESAKVELERLGATTPEHQAGIDFVVMRDQSAHSSHLSPARIRAE